MSESLNTEPDMLELTVAQGNSAGDEKTSLSNEARSELNVLTGDYVVVSGDDGRVSLKVWSPPAGYSVDTSEVLLSKKVRDHLGVSNGGDVTVRPTNSNNMSVDFSDDGFEDQLTSLKDTDTPSEESVTANAMQDTEDPEEEQNLPQIGYDDIGGLGNELEEIREAVELPLNQPDVFSDLGIDPPKGVLLYGPPGTGKTLIAKAVANTVDAKFFNINGPEIMSKYKGESEARLREVFEKARNNGSSIIFFDEIDSLAPKRGDTGDVENRLVGQLLSLMDGVDTGDNVMVIGATNRVDTLDPALRRGGRFDREIEIGVPDRTGREEILNIHTEDMPLSDEVHVGNVASRTHGFVGADLATLCSEAAMDTLRRLKNDDGTINADSERTITQDDFDRALRDVEPSAMREFVAEAPDTTFNDVGGLDDAKQTLKQSVEWPLRYTNLFNSTNTSPPSGILMHGVPGTGKTLLARALAGESDVNFIHVDGPELIDKYVGESEKAVRELFSRARQASPSIIFFDEIDAIASKRNDNTNEVTERVISQLITELDSLEDNPNVTVLAATNSRDSIDPSLLRPGRLEEEVEIGLPDTEARRDIFDIHAEGKPLAENIDNQLVADMEGVNGADIEVVVRSAAMMAIDESVEEKGVEAANEDASEIVVTEDHFNAAIEQHVPDLERN